MKVYQLAKNEHQCIFWGTNTFSIDKFDHFFDQSTEPVEERQKRETDPCKQWLEKIQECKRVKTCCKEKSVPENCLKICRRKVKISEEILNLKPNEN